MNRNRLGQCVGEPARMTAFPTEATGFHTLPTVTHLPAPRKPKEERERFSQLI
ncbi:MAG: hypothetical protein PUP91_12845 [Rhizonema sp. PD37]|nr:hypothetical protein [Rhizonema sp. PD37]